MITSIAIENFKGIRERVELEFRPITLLFGANSAGKSTIVQALQYAREVLRSHNLDADRTAAGGDGVRLGGFRQFIHNHDLRRPLVLKIGFQFSSAFSFADYYEPPDDDWSDELPLLENSPTTGAVELTIRWYRQLGRPVVTEYRLELDGVLAGSIECNPERKDVHIASLNQEHPLFLTPGKNADDWDDAAVWGLANRLPIPLAGQTDALPETRRPLVFATETTGGSDDAERKRLEGVFSKIFLAPLENLVWDLARFRFLGAMRALPPAGVLDTRENNGHWADGGAAWRQLLAGEEEFIDQVNAWLSGEEKLDAGYRVRRRKIAQIDQASPLWLALASGRAFDEVEDLAQQLTDLPTATSIALVDQRRGGLEVAPHDVGIGVTQLVPLTESPRADVAVQLGLLRRMCTFYNFVAFASPYLSAAGSGKDLAFAVKLAKAAFQRPRDFVMPARIDLHTEGDVADDAKHQADAAAIIERVKAELKPATGTVRLFLWRQIKERSMMFGTSDDVNKQPKIVWAVSATHVARPDSDNPDRDRHTFSVLPADATSRLASDFYSPGASKRLYAGSPFQQS